MGRKLTFETWKEYLSNTQEQKKKWKQITVKQEHEQRIFDILTVHNYSFNFNRVPSDNEFGTEEKKYYIDSKFRWVLAKISEMRNVQYLKDSTIQKIIQSIQWIRDCEKKALDTYTIQSDPNVTIKSRNDYEKDDDRYHSERYNNAKIVDWEVYLPWTTDEEILAKDVKYWEDTRKSDRRQESLKENIEKEMKQLKEKGLIDESGQISLDFWE